MKLNKILMPVMLVLWLGLLAAVGYFASRSLENARLKEKNLLLEKKAAILTTQLGQCQQQKTADERLENFFEWQFVLSDQVKASGQRILQEISRTKDVARNKELMNILLVNLGLNYTLARDFDSAIKVFEKAVIYNPKDAQSYYNLGLLYASYGKRDAKKAVENYQQYLKLIPYGDVANQVKERVALLEGKK